MKLQRPRVAGRIRRESLRGIIPGNSTFLSYQTLIFDCLQRPIVFGVFCSLHFWRFGITTKQEPLVSLCVLSRLNPETSPKSWITAGQERRKRLILSPRRLSLTYAPYRVSKVGPSMLYLTKLRPSEQYGFPSILKKSHFLNALQAKFCALI